MRRTSLLLLALLSFSGCASISSTTPTIDTQAAHQLMREGHYQQAALAWTAQANASRGAQRDHAWLQAADAWLQQGQPTAAQQALAQVKRKRLIGEDAVLHDLLSAQFKLDANRPQDAAPLLQQARESIPETWLARWHTLRSRLFAKQGDGFANAAELAWLVDLAKDRTQRSNYQREIDQRLAVLPDSTLTQRSAALPVGHPLYPYAGRVLTQRGLPLPRPYQRTGLSTNEIPPAEHDGYRPPLRISVLLPLSGPLAVVGHSVRDGLLTAYYAQPRRRPQLNFHDTHQGLDKALAEARKQGAQLLIGPLGRDEVTMLFEHATGNAPALALNRSPLTPPQGSASFALSPEDEGAASADRLADRGQLRVLAIRQDDDQAQRALSSFRERLRIRGGEVVAEVALQENNPDYVPQLQQGIAAAAGSPPQALFITLKAAPARLLAAQLELVGLADIPRLATSLILAGANPRMDSELDGIEFPELPWLLGLRSTLPEPEGLARRLPTAQGAGARLFAFGLDAWQLAAYFEHLGNHPDAVIRGATGTLRLDGFGTVTREPEWAVFSGGRPRPVLDGALLPDATQTD